MLKKHEMKDYLKTLDKETRIQLLSGEHYRHDFSQRERDELFFRNKLTKGDLRELGVDSSVMNA